MLKYYVVDAFTDKIFQGNPAGVCVLDRWLPEETMLQIAIENNLSETAFCVKEHGNLYGLRWYTPGGEIDLCGHATIATAYVLFRFYEKEETHLRFHAKKAGHRLEVYKQDDLLQMDFPTIAPRAFAYDETMTEAMGEKPAEVFCTDRDLLLVYDDEQIVCGLTPNFEKVKALQHGLSVYVTAKSERFDFVARAFWPKLNINEDPVCGAMYCTLIPYWKERLNKDVMVARQVSKRGGTVWCEYFGERVRISGKAALYAIGDLFVEE